VPSVVLGGRAVASLRAAAVGAVSDAHPIAPLMMAAVPFWLALAGPLAAAGKLWMDRRDRLDGDRGWPL
jgi:hypothetical protein